MATRKTARPAARTAKAAKARKAAATPTAEDAGTRRRARAAARTQREIGRKALATAKKAPKPAKKAVQAGTRRQPVNPMPATHLAKPGAEHALALAPRFEAPDYAGSGKLEGLAAIVTGGDSGIGRAVAVLFAREGADVAVLHLDEARDAAETKRHVEAEGRRCIVIAGDVGDPRFCEAAVAETVASFGRLDVLVNNAAFQQHVARIEDLADDHLEQTLRTNIGGYFHMARAAVPHLPRGGSIVNTGSETGLFGSPQLLDYSATKGAIHAFTMALASKLLPRGIRVNCVAPGPVWTPLNPADRDPAAIAAFGKDSAMGRPAQPEELSPAYVFLASPVTASYISGVVLPVMGGPRG